jgi:hypothetical protein
MSHLAIRRSTRSYCNRRRNKSLRGYTDADDSQVPRPILTAFCIALQESPTDLGVVAAIANQDHMLLREIRKLSNSMEDITETDAVEQRIVSLGRSRLLRFASYCLTSGNS